LLRIEQGGAGKGQGRKVQEIHLGKVEFTQGRKTASAGGENFSGAAVAPVGGQSVDNGRRIETLRKMDKGTVHAKMYFVSGITDLTEEQAFALRQIAETGKLHCKNTAHEDSGKAA
jgi:hypothetical protein